MAEARNDWEDAPVAEWEDAPEPKSAEKSVTDYQDVIKGSRAQLIPPGSPLSGSAIEAGLAVLEQPGAGLYGLGSMMGAGIAAGVNTFREGIGRLFSGVRVPGVGRFEEKPPVYPGLSMGEVFTEEYNRIARNAADAYVPVTPGGELLAHKISELLTKGIQGAGGFVFEKGLPSPEPVSRTMQELGLIKMPGADSPAVAAGTEALTTLAMLAVPFGKRAPRTPLVPKAPETWAEFALEHPETAKAIDGSSLGAVRFRRQDTSVLDAVTRQVDTELGLTGTAAEIPLRAKMLAVIDKVAPDLPAGERLRAVEALERKIELVDKIRVDIANTRGLPAPATHPFDKPITVTEEGMAFTAEQARMLDREFRAKTPSERADALAVSLMGQLRVQTENVLKQAEGTAARDLETRALRKMVEQSFPDYPPGAREGAMEKLLNFQGRLTYPQMLEAIGPFTKRRAQIWRKTEAGAIDIEGLDYILQSFKDLPDQPILKRATIVGQLNRMGVPQAEKDVVLRALRDRDSITQEELVKTVSADVIPMQPKVISPSGVYSENVQSGIRRIDPSVRPQQARTTVWTVPFETGFDAHFDVPNYFAHTRGFDKGSTRSLIELQSDLQTKGRGDVQFTKRTTAQVADLEAAIAANDTKLANKLAKDYAKDHGIKDTSPQAVLGELKSALEYVFGSAEAYVMLPKGIHNLRRWGERILMEENRQAARDGKTTYRVADADTVARASMWLSGYKNGRHQIEPVTSRGTTYVGAIVKGGALEKVLVRGKDGKVEAVDTSPAEFRRLPPEFHNAIPRGDLPAHLQTVFDFYKDDVSSFARSRFDAKHVVDEYGNGWWEWKVNPEDATKKIPAFGGRQKGAIDIPEFEDAVRAAERGRSATEQAAGRAWATPQPASDELYGKVKSSFDKSRLAEEEARKTTSTDVAKRVLREVEAHDRDLRAELERAGIYGERAILRRTAQNGATMSAKTLMDNINEKIFNQMDSATKNQVDELMRLRRIIEIDSYKGVGKHKHPEGINGPQAESVALRMQRELGPEQFSKVYDFTNRIMAEYKDILNRRHASGLLSDDSYLKLLHFDYSPTQFIDLIDPLQTYDIHGHKLTVRTSGVPFLERGKKGEAMMDSQVLLAEALVRSENLIFRNETLKALHTLAKEVPENPVVRLPKEGMVGRPGTPDAYVKHTPKGWASIGVRQEGKQDFIFMREDLAEQFITRPQVMSDFVNTMFRMFSGTAAVKATATTYNPGFIIAGLPMDILHTWIASSGAYSPHLPVYAGQMAMDLAATMGDAWIPSRRREVGGRYQQAMREGLGSAFMTHEGRGFTGLTEKSMSVAEKQLLPKFDGLKGALSYINESADLWVRMAHRERLIKQGMEPWEATARARDRLDYSAGGEFTRAVDTVLPYTNVAVQALSKVIRSGAKDPGEMATKLAWGGAAITGWTLANIISSPETWQQIPTSDKIRSLPITFGDQWYITDPDGNKRYVYMPGVRLDATVAPIAATIIAGLEQAEYGRPPDSILSKSFANLNPVLEFQAPPVISAVGTYLSNFDAFTGRQITPHAGQVLPQNEGLAYGRGEPPSLVSRAVGESLGLSPPRLDAAARKVINPNNTYLSLMGWGYKFLFADDPRTQVETATEQLLKNPAIRPFVKLTNPSTQFMQQVDEARMGEGSRRKQMTDSVDNLLFQVRHEQASLRDVQTYITNQAPEDREWLGNYAKTAYNVKQIMQRFGASEDIPNESWWRAVSSLEARPRAQEFYSQWLSASPEGRARMERIAAGLHNAGAGFMSDNFRRELAKERELLGTERR